MRGPSKLFMIIGIGVLLLTSSLMAQNVRNKNILTFTAPPAYAPLSWKVENTIRGVRGNATIGGMSDGIVRAFIEVLKERKKLRELKNDPLPFYFDTLWQVRNFGQRGRIGEGIQQGEPIDFVVGLYFDEETNLYMDYLSTPIYEDTMGIVVDASTAAWFQGKETLIDKPGIIRRGERLGPWFDLFRKDAYGAWIISYAIDGKKRVAQTDPSQVKPLRLQEVDQIQDGFNQILSGAALYMVGGKLSFQSLLINPIYQGKLAFIPLQENGQDIKKNLYVAIHRESPFYEHRDFLEEHLKEMKKDGRLEQLWQENVKKCQESGSCTFLN